MTSATKKPLPHQNLPGPFRRLLADESTDRQRPVILAVVLTLAAIGLVEVTSAS